jgi:hypothetical protein
LEMFPFPIPLTGYYGDEAFQSSLGDVPNETGDDMGATRLGDVQFGQGVAPSPSILDVTYSDFAARTGLESNDPNADVVRQRLEPALQPAAAPEDLYLPTHTGGSQHADSPGPVGPAQGADQLTWHEDIILRGLTPEDNTDQSEGHLGGALSRSSSWNEATVEEVRSQVDRVVDRDLEEEEEDDDEDL